MSNRDSKHDVIEHYAGHSEEKGRIYRIVFAVLCVLLTLLMAFYYFFGRIGTLEIRAYFLMSIMALCYFPKSTDKYWKQGLDIIFMGLSVLVSWYFITHNYEMKMSFFDMSPISLSMGSVMILLILEATRRKIGWIMPSIAVIFLLYAFFGYLIPGKYGTNGYSIGRIINISYTGTEGIYGTPIGVMVSTVFLFMLFGTLLQSSGAGKFFIDFSKAAMGNVAGGPAKIAVVSSMLFGSINGSAVANTVATGSFTIPLMKETGYDSEFAGAVEATSSTGGQIMPPIMGAGAFLIAELTGISYSTIALISIIPAILYYGAIFISIHLEAKKKRLQGVPKSELPKMKDVLIHEGVSALPLLLLLILIIFVKISVQYAAIFSIALILILGLIRKKGKEKVSFIGKGIEAAVTSILSIAISCACAGIIVGMVTLTGLGYNFSSSLLGLANGNLFLALILLFAMGLILGMGLPTVAAFVLMVSIAGPGLTNMGLPVLTAYLITFWFAQTSAITPPVCLAAYAAAGIANAKPFRVGIQAMKLGFPLLIIPYLMAYRSLLFTGPVYESISTIITGSIGVISFCTLFIGYFFAPLKWYHRVLALFAGVCCFWPNQYADIVGVVLFIILLLMSRNDSRRQYVRIDG